MKKMLLSLLIHLGLHKVLRPFAKRKVVILTYHGFVEEGDLDPIENDEGRFLRVSELRRQLSYLQANYNVVSIERVIAYYEEGRELPDYPVVITVDDGYASFYHLALPLLKEMNFPATILLATNFVDQQESLWPDRVEYALIKADVQRLDLPLDGIPVQLDLRTDAARRRSLVRLRGAAKAVDTATLFQAVRDLEERTGVSLGATKDPPTHVLPISWEQVAEAADTGLVCIGSHSTSHCILTRCSEEDARSEAVCSKAIVEEHLGGACTVFCYPNGELGDFNNTTRDLIGQAGYRCGLTTVAGLNDRHTDVFELKRYGVDDRDEWYQFVAAVSGLHDYLSRAKEGATRWRHRLQRAKSHFSRSSDE